MPVICVEPPTKEEIEKYRKAKHEQYLQSFSDEVKMTKMKPKASGRIGKILFGVCPVCNHCVIGSDTYCDECFQRLDWSDFETK